MCFIYDGYAEFTKEKLAKAKKQHKCGECYEIIFPGQTYEYVVGVYDGDFFTFKTCLPCVKIRKEIHDNEILEGCGEHEAWPPYGSLFE